MLFFQKTEVNCKNFLFRNLILPTSPLKRGQSGRPQKQKQNMWKKVGEGYSNKLNRIRYCRVKPIILRKI